MLKQAGALERAIAEPEGMAQRRAIARLGGLLTGNLGLILDRLGQHRRIAHFEHGRPCGFQRSENGRDGAFGIGGDALTPQRCQMARKGIARVKAHGIAEMLADVTREPVTRRLSLGGLSEGETLEYAELTSADIASAEVVAALYEETEGNPLFVGEMLRLLAVEGVRSGSPAEVRLAIPQSVRDVIARRLTHLSGECNRVLVLASVLGREFALEALSRMGGVSEEELLDLLDEAMTARVVSDVGGGAGRLRFAHVLIRDTLYEGLSSARRVRLHRLAVEALEALYGDEPGPHLAELAYHSVAGSDFDKGLLYGRRAGDRSLRLLAYEEAARLFRQTLDIGGPELDGEDRCTLLLAAGTAAHLSADLGGRLDACLEAGGSTAGACAAGIETLPAIARISALRATCESWAARATAASSSPRAWARRRAGTSTCPAAPGCRRARALSSTRPRLPCPASCAPRRSGRSGARAA